MPYSCCFPCLKYVSFYVSGKLRDLALEKSGHTVDVEAGKRLQMT